MRTAFALGIFAMSGCAADGAGVSGAGADLAPGEDWGDSTKYPELGGAYHSLDALNGTCTFANGVVTVALAAGQTVIIGTRAIDSAILVNDATCSTVATATVPATAATKTSMKRLVVTGSSGDDVVILDFIGGVYAKGVASATAGGIVVDGVSGTDSVRIRGTTGADEFYMGTDGIAFDRDQYKDITLTNIDSVNVALADGNDTFVASNAVATRGITGNYGAALTVYGGTGNDTLTGGAEADTLYGGPGNDTMNGGVGNTGAPSIDTLYGEEGNDVMAQSDALDGDDVLDCGEDSSGTDVDMVSYAARTAQIVATVGGTGGQGAEADAINANCEGLEGGSGHDKLVGDAGNNTLTGGAGNDALIGLDGDDILNGGDGNDTFVESYLSAGVAVASADGVITWTAGAGDVNVNTADNGADIMNGNAGTDSVDYRGRTGALDITMNGTAADDGLSGEEDNVKADVENAVGGSGNDEITGNALNNTLFGGMGTDVLDGGAGDDTFDEGTATNNGDTFIGGAGIDTVNYGARTVALTVTMGDDTANDGEGGATEGDNVKADVENLVGGTQGDNITGNDLDNVLNGANGADTISGGAGNDRVDGGDTASANILSCGAGTDIAVNVGTGGTRATDCEL